MPRRDISAAKNKISKDAMEWLDKESSSGPINRSEEFDKIIEVCVPADGPFRGFSLFSKRPIRQFEVLGAYAGTFYGSVKDLNEASRKTGHGRTVSYAWEGKQLGQQVDARESGNRLALMNTARLPGHADLLGKENNIAAIRIGNSLWFYVAIKNIDKGEELLVDYGPAYNPSGIKIEPDQ
jgi:SET domain-containing protein